MPGCRDLTPRQAARALRQALRCGAELELELRSVPDAAPLRGRLCGHDRTGLVVDVGAQADGLPLPRLVGAFCDVRMTVLDDLYLFGTCVADVAGDRGARRLLLASPQHMQMADRRRWPRLRPEVPVEVRLRTSPELLDHLGMLVDIGFDGLACEMPGRVLDELLCLGDRLTVRFALPGRSQVYVLPVEVCGKQFCARRQCVLLNLAFCAAPGGPEQRALQGLRLALGAHIGRPRSDREGP